MIRHFWRFQPHDTAGTAEKLVYYQGYRAAIEAAPKHELTHPCDQWWYRDLRDCVGRAKLCTS